MTQKSKKKKGKKGTQKKAKKPGTKAKKSDKAKKADKKSVTAFFIMPAEALVTLREELSPLASELAVRAILFRYGFRSGEACLQSMDIKTTKDEMLPDILPNLWDEIGLGRLILIDNVKEGFTLELSESIEANVIGNIGQSSCDFTRGYLAGMVSHLSKKKYHCREERCISKGDDHCTFHLNIRRRERR
ncbi:MAG: hypothetical protein JSV09_04700 [Thermoplasmata archaeon]|nr:MAG: hypothetical protein JSV09_04700 [Thermoplasmata archaeon]